jgi:hypothetical protein
MTIELLIGFITTSAERTADSSNGTPS